MNIQEYNQKKNEIFENIESVKKICEVYEDLDNQNKLEHLVSKMEKDVFQLVVVGEFSRGKSTLINALLGDDILPSDPNPTTVMLNVIKNSDGEHYLIHYRNGDVKEISKEDFKNIVAKNDNDASNFSEAIMQTQMDAMKKMQVKYAEIQKENDFGKIGIDVVDTPGINDIDKTREEVTLKYIPESDAAIIVCSAIQQLTSSEHKFIKEQLIGNHITKIFVAVAYADVLQTDEERVRVYNCFRDGLNGIVPPERIFLVSSKKALKYKLQKKGKEYKNPVATYEESGFDVFETAIQEYLANERGNIKLQNYRAELAGIIDGIINNTFALRKQAIQMSKQDLYKEIDELGPKSVRLQKKFEKELELAHKELLNLRSKFANEYENRLKDMGKAALNEVNLYDGQDVDELFGLISDAVLPYERSIQNDFLQDIQLKMKDILSTHMEEIGEDFAQIGIQSNFSGAVSNDSQMRVLDESAMNRYYSDKSDSSWDVGDVLLVGAIGLAAVAVGALIVSHPFVYIGARALGHMLSSSGSSNEQNQTETVNTQEIETQNESTNVSNEMIKKVYSAEVRKCYYSSISTKIAEFKTNYQDSVKRMLEGVHKEAKALLDNHMEQLQMELENKKEETYQFQESLLQLQQKETMLEEIQLWCRG